jgi:hypothetical protein
MMGPRTYPSARGPYMLRKSFVSVFIRLGLKARVPYKAKALFHYISMTCPKP